MNVLKQWLVKQLSQKAKMYLKSQGFLITGKYNRVFVLEPEGKRVLVLAPHEDDEVIGCGGTIHKHVRNGAEVMIVYMTDGRYGSKALENLYGEERRKVELELIKIRKQEARLAMEVLGVRESIFLDVEDSHMTSTDEMRTKLRQILFSLKPDVVYLPFFLEEHPDHRMTNQILLDATEGGGFRFTCYGYEVWTTLVPNCLVEITDVCEIKTKALECYRSQLAEKNYLYAFLGLNAYRSITLEREGFAEAFFRCPLEEYRELYKFFMNPSLQRKSS